MQLKNKRAIFLGDSITEGAAADSPEKIYHAVLKNLIGLKSARNEGVGGTRIARQITPSAVERYDEDFNKRYDAMNKDADVLFIFGGTNDFGHGDAPIGKEDDESVYTFNGALNTLFKKAIFDFGKENVIVMTPLHRVGEDNLKGEGNKAADGEKLSFYAEVIRKQAKKYGLPVIDLYGEKALNPNISDNAKFFADGLHPNNDGHALLAKIIKERLGEI